MKVANITLHAINNYGSVLQALATERIFQDLGCEVQTIDYVRETAQLDSVLKILKYGGPELSLKIKQLILHFLPKNRNIDKIFNEFRQTNLHLSSVKYLSDSDLNNNYPNADIYCTGSDQTWNIECQGGIPFPYFLSFVPDEKRKIAFSASFGMSSISDEYKPIVQSLLKRYDSISVRELSGKKILDDLGIASTHVLDPTIVVGRNFWLNFAGDRFIDGDYLFVYQLNRSNSFEEYVVNFAKKKNLRIVYTKSRPVRRYKGAVYIIPTPEQLLSLFKYSTYVITDSFHATVFSLMFHCNFVDIYPPKFPTRLESILELVGLKDRVITDFSKFDYHDKRIDYNTVDSILDEQRTLTLDYVRKAIQV